MKDSLQNVLLVEDSRDIQFLVKTSIDDICNLKIIGSATLAGQELDKGDYSLLLLDVNLPDGDGFEFCIQLRKQKRFLDLPIMFLTGKTKTADKVLGFQVGADDYITKPFEPQELRARVEGKLRRGKSVKNSFQVPGFRVDLGLQKIFITKENSQDQTLPLTPLEFKVLSHLMQNQGSVYSRQDLIDMFWADSPHVSKHTVDTHISSLRKKMGLDGQSLRSIYKRGYSFSIRPLEAGPEV